MNWYKNLSKAEQRHLQRDIFPKDERLTKCRAEVLVEQCLKAQHISKCFVCEAIQRKLKAGA